MLSSPSDVQVADEEIAVACPTRLHGHRRVVGSFDDSSQVAPLQGGHRVGVERMHELIPSPAESHKSEE